MVGLIFLKYVDLLISLLARFAVDAARSINAMSSRWTSRSRKRRSASIDTVRFSGAILVFPLLCFLSFASFASAQVALSLPLQGHYRAGRYMPVSITTAHDSGAVSIEGNGAIPTSLVVHQGTNVIVPWLATSQSLRNLRWSMPGIAPHLVGLPLSPLGDDEKLVGFAGEQPSAMQALFPGNTIVPIALDLSRPLLEPVQAWEALDGIVLSAAALARLDENHRGLLIASGTMLAVRSDPAPDTRWPWKQVGKYWVLRPDLSGPRTIIVPSAYLPTYGWERGWPASFRRGVISIAILFCILGAGVLLWRSRWAVAGFVVLCAITIGGFGAWYARRSPILQMTAGVMTRDSSLAQYDLWTWQSPIRVSPGSFSAAGLTHPVFATDRQVEQSQIRLECTADGRPDRFTFYLGPDRSLAFLTRLVRRDENPVPLQSAARSLSDFAAELYLRPGEHVAGQFQVNNPYTGAATPVVRIDGR